MPQITGAELTHLLTIYGYLAVLVFIAIESTGIPFPGETMLVVASIYAGTTHHLQIVFVIAAAAAGAILGDNLGFWIGREGGYRLLRRFGHVIRLDERRLKLGQYMFLRHGGKVVFFGRFFAILRAWAAFLAGTNRMRWPEFLFFNAAGGILWATIFGMGGYILGSNIHRILGPFGTISAVFVTILLVALFFFVRRNERRLEDEAERALPGSLDDYQPGGSRFHLLQRIAEGKASHAPDGLHHASPKGAGDSPVPAAPAEANRASQEQEVAPADSPAHNGARVPASTGLSRRRVRAQLTKRIGNRLPR